MAQQQADTVGTTKIIDTKTSIMDAGERLMAKHGLNGVSLRAIVAEADANSAALHYHFGSRDALVEAILTRNGRPNSLRRREMIDALEARDKAPTTTDVVGVMVGPFIEMLQENGEAGRCFLRFLARLQSDRVGIQEEMEKKYFPGNRKRIARMLAQAAPHLTPEVQRLRVTMTLDTMLQSLAGAEFMAHPWKKKNSEKELRAFARVLVDYLAGGLSAPVSNAN